MFNSAAGLFLACILAGFALLHLPPLTGLLAMPLLKIIGILVILIFSFTLIYMGARVLFKGSWS